MVDEVVEPPPPPPLPHLMDELIEEILLRFPADSPASLIRAGLVCRRWCRLVSDPGFHRRFRELHHRSPPVLGFLYADTISGKDAAITRFVPRCAPAACPPAQADLGLRLFHGAVPCDSRHGRVLLLRPRTRLTGFCAMVVWDPITGERLAEVPEPPIPLEVLGWTAAVLCAAADCDHLDCHRGPFVVVLVAFKGLRNISCVYSSDNGSWSKPNFAWHLYDFYAGYITMKQSSILAGNALYFLIESDETIIKYDLGTTKMSPIKLPKAPLPPTNPSRCQPPPGRIQLATMEDGRLGFARVEEKTKLCLWSREADDDDARWVRSKVIEVVDKAQQQAHDDAIRKWPVARPPLELLGSAENAGVIVLTLYDKLFTVDLRLGRVTKLPTHHRSSLLFIYRMIPYMNFYNPVLRLPSNNGRRRITKRARETSLSDA